MDGPPGGPGGPLISIFRSVFSNFLLGTRISLGVGRTSPVTVAMLSYPGGSPWERRTGRCSAGPREIDPTAGRSEEQDGGPTGTAAESADEIGPPAGAGGRSA